MGLPVSAIYYSRFLAFADVLFCKFVSSLPWWL